MSSARRICGSTALRHREFSISAAARATSSTSAGILATVFLASTPTPNPFSPQPLSCSASLALSAASNDKRGFLILAASSTSLPHTAFAFTASAKCGKELNGRRPTGNFSLTTCAPDSWSQTGDCSSILIRDRTVLLFSLGNCAIFSNHRAHEFFDPKHCWARIQTAAHDLSKSRSGD